VKTSERECHERIGLRIPGNTGLRERTQRVLESLELRAAYGRVGLGRHVVGGRRNGMRGRRRREAELATVEGKPL
jgi:hypothetical protein